MNPMDPNTRACQRCGTLADLPLHKVTVLREQEVLPAGGGGGVTVPGTGVERAAWTCKQCGTKNQIDVLF